MPELVALCYLLHLRSGIGDRNEPVASLAGLLEEILLENIWLERAARFAGDDEQALFRVDLRLRCPNLRRVGGIQNEQLRASGNLAERHLQHFWTQTRPAHAQ